MTNVVSVAAHIINAFDGKVDAIKLQKLVYYSQGWHLAAHDQPLFEEPVKAYQHGPVVGVLWNLHRGRRIVTSVVLPASEVAPLSESEQAVVDAVLEAYGSMKKWDLVKQTHRERPWIDAWDDEYDDRITLDAMKTYFAYVSAIPSAASGPRLPKLACRSVTYALQTDLDALGDLEVADDVSRLLAAVGKA